MASTHSPLQWDIFKYLSNIMDIVENASDEDFDGVCQEIVSSFLKNYRQLVKDYEKDEQIGPPMLPELVKAIACLNPEKAWSILEVMKEELLEDLAEAMDEENPDEGIIFKMGEWAKVYREDVDKLIDVLRAIANRRYGHSRCRCKVCAKCQE